MKRSREDDDASVRSKKVAAPTQSTGSETIVLDLNDDCLREVFDILCLEDLAAVADVCTRFRRIAKQSAQLICKRESVRSKFENVSFNERTSVCDYSILRNFGASIESVGVLAPEKKYTKRLIDYLDRYCMKTPVNLKIEDYAHHETALISMLPLLGRVHKLRIVFWEWNDEIMKNLASLSPELRVLSLKQKQNPQYPLESAVKFNNLHQKFPKLESISLDNIRRDEKNHNIEQFLQLNPQLKRIEVDPSIFNDCIFQSIAKYVPTIEKINSRNGDAKLGTNLEYFGHLRELKSLSIVVDNIPQYWSLQAVIQELASANIPLEDLNLYRPNFHRICPQLIADILKLQHLKTLRLDDFKNLEASHLIELCKHHKKLVKIHLHRADFQLNAENLLEFVRNAETLEKFICNTYCRQNEPQNICVDTFNELVKIVGQRRVKTKLSLALGTSAYDISSIPAESISAANGLLTLEIAKNEFPKIFHFD